MAKKQKKADLWKPRREALEPLEGEVLERAAFELLAAAEHAAKDESLSPRERGQVERAYYVSIEALGRVDSPSAAEKLVGLLPEEDWRSPLYNVTSRALLASPRSDIAARLCEGKARAAVRLLGRLGDPESIPALEHVVEEASAEGTKPKTLVFVYGVVALAALGHEEARDGAAEMLADPVWIRNTEYRNLVETVMGSSGPELIYELLGPATRRMRADPELGGNLESLLMAVSGRARHIGADPRWRALIQPELDDPARHRLVGGLFEATLPEPHYEALLEFAGQAGAWSYMMVEALARQADPRGLEIVMANIETPNRGYASAALAEFARMTVEVDLDRLERALCTELAEVCRQPRADLDLAATLVDSILAGRVRSPELVREAAAAMATGSFVYENKRIGPRWRKELVSRLEAAASDT